MRPHQTNILLPALSLFLHKTLFAEVFGVNKVMSSTPAPAARPGNHIIPQARGELYDYYELRNRGVPLPPNSQPLAVVHDGIRGSRLQVAP